MHKARFHQALPQILARYPRARWLFLTVTVRNCPITELRATLTAMNQAWQRLIQRKDWPALGWIRSIEVTRGADGSAHPHFHALLLVRPSYFTHGYVKQAEWTERWQSAARLNYAPVVDVRSAKGAAAAAEALKYSTKPSDLAADPAWLEELTRQTHKLRFLATGGVLKNALRELEKNESELLNPGESEDGGGSDSVDLRFAWQRAELRYKRC
jgi:plasmid rolling circle replication initiator protein Rep